MYRIDLSAIQKLKQTKLELANGYGIVLYLYSKNS